MLIKLFKHEIKATSRIFLPMYGLLAIFSVITKLAHRYQRVDSLFTGILVVVPTFLYGCIIVGILIMTVVMLIQRFSKNLLGSEGYLMHTLPVRPGAHIVCKLVTTSIWTIFTTFAVFFSALYMAVDVSSWGSFFEKFKQNLDQAGTLFQMSGEVFFWGIVLLCVTYIVKMTLMIYAGMGIGQLAAKHKVGISIAVLAGMYIVEQLLGLCVMYLIGLMSGGGFPFRDAPSAQMIRLLFWWYFGTSTLFGTVYALISNWMLKRHLNLA